MSEEVLREVGALAPVIELEFSGAEADDSALSETELDAWIVDVRELTEADVAARRLTGVSPLPNPGDASDRAPARLGVRLAVGLAVALVAIVAGLVVAVPRLLQSFVDGSYREAVTPNQAEYQERDTDAPARAGNHPTLSPPTPQRAVTHELAPPHQGSTDPNPKPQPKPQAALDELLLDRLDELEAAAQGQWAAGELVRAQASYREIITLAGRRRQADLAFGDLFTLAHQRGDMAAELALWREYLVKFPAGRFADDARAGLCRRTSDQGSQLQRDCWRDYLADFPKGLHVSVATRALGTHADDVVLAPEDP